MSTFLDNELKVIFIIICIFGYIFFSLKRKYDYWKSQNVPYIGFPKDLVLTSRKHSSLVLKDIYDKFTAHPFCGIYQATTPILLIRDPKIIQSILIKDFSSFMDRNQNLILNENLDPLNANILNLRGQRWKNIRSKLSPIFSSSKLRSMFFLLEKCTDVLQEYLQEILTRSSEIEVRELMAKFATDVIGICAFGLDGNAIKDEKSEFRRMSRKLEPKGFKLFFRVILRAIHPNLYIWLGMKGFDAEVENFFFSLFRSTVKTRAGNDVTHKDFIQLLIKLQQDEQKSLQDKTDNPSEPLFAEHILVANLAIFFVAGFDTIAATLSYCLYELALNPDVMEKLYKEIKQAEQARSGKLDYDAFKEMSYLDAVISETLRKHPPAGALLRSCNTTYRIPNSSLVIQKGAKVSIPVYALHHDQIYFPDPEKFDPERFNEENKRKIVPGSYLPFGDGPRMCIGIRFALMEVKAAVARIIGNYTIHPTEKTEVPITLNPRSLLMVPRKVHLKIQKRGHSS